MAQIVENWAEISGTVTDISDHPTMQGYKQIGLALRDSREVEGFPNLARPDEGEDIRINVRAEKLDEAAVKKGERFEGTVRKAFGREYFLK